MKTPLSILLGFFILLSSAVKSQCQYTFSTLGQSIYVNGDPTMTNVNTLSTCTEYVFDYSITFNASSTSPITDDITLELPLNVSFQSLVSPDPAITLNSSSGNSVSLHLSAWNKSNTLNIKMIGISSSCDASTVTGNPLSVLHGTSLACNTLNSSNSVTVVSPQLLVDMTGTAMKNIGDVDEIVFRIRNTGANSSVIQNLLVNYTLNSNINSYSNTYYISGSSTQGAGNNSYTYTPPSSGIYTSALPSSSFGIAPADFQNVLGHGYLGNGEEIYLHIPYFVNDCGTTTGNFNFLRDCGNSTTCDNVTLTHNITVHSGNTTIETGNIVPLGSQNGTFCSTAGQQNTSLGWEFHGSSSVISGGPSGYTRATDLQLLVLVDNSFGSVVPNTFTISNGTSSIDVSGVTTPVTTTFPMLSTPTTATIYKIDLTQLSVVPYGWQPLGPNSLSDLDGDGKLDDLIELGMFEIHVDYNYNTTCPLYNDHSAYYTVAMLQWYYKNACGVPVDNSAIGGNFSWYQASSDYKYSAVGGGGELTLPPDVLTNEPFVSELCFAPYYETYTPGLEFECPNGFHRVIYEIPSGYHLNVSGLTSSSTASGWYELPIVTATSISGPANGTVQITPIVKEYCNPGGTGRIIEIRFGHLPSSVANGLSYTYQLLECIDLPMYLNCAASDPSCPGLPNNFGFDNLDFRLEYVCDETCNTCTSYIIGGSASTYHHCLGECLSYFGTDAHPVFERTSLGFVNTTTGYTMGSDLTLPSNLTVNTAPTIDLSRAYPGDQVSLQVNGSFDGTPDPSGVSVYPAHIGSTYTHMYLQIRYDDLLPAERKEARLFDLEQLSGDGIVITENSPTNGISTYTVPVSDMTMTDYVITGTVYLNIDFLSPAAALFMDESAATYTFHSNLHLRVRSEPTSSTNHYFFSYGKHVLTSLRFEYKGVIITEIEDGETYEFDGSCDDYGANFKILQPTSYGPEGLFIGEPTYCGLTDVYFRFYNDAALFQIGNDFPNEYRAYGQLNPDIAVTVPAGYTFVSASFVQDGKEYNSSLPNNFGPNYIPGHITVPMTPFGPNTTDMYGNTIVHFKGINNSTWPSLDLESGTGSQYIYLKLIPNCDIPVHSNIYVTGDYTLSVNQDLPTYQYTYPFTSQIELGHYAPHINIVNPVATVNAYNGTTEFAFSVCNESTPMTGPANQAWFAFENSVINGLDLNTATLVTVPGNTPVPFTTYTNAAGDQGIIANVGNIPASACLNFKLIAHVNSNGCVETNTVVADYLTVYGGNSCTGAVLSEPSPVCTDQTTQFAFNRYPSDLELILPENAYPTDPVEMCNGILEYNFILNSYEIGAVNNIQFWLDLPTGLSLSNATFSTPVSSPTATYSTSTYDGATYGAGGNLPGWTILPHFGSVTSLPGSLNAPNNQILVHLEVQSSCNYDLSSPVLCYANAINSCGQETGLLEMSSLPLISNTTLANDLIITPTITFSDSTDTLNCNNTATVTLTITNNSNVSNLTDLVLTTQVPGSPLIINPGSGTHTGNEVTWNIPANTLPANSTTSVTYTITNPGVICQNDVPLSASIHFSENVSCSSTGGSCNVELTTDTVFFDIDVCCNCDLVLETSSEPKHCKYYGSATVNVSGGSGTYTYLWNDGQTTSTAINLLPGTYTVTVTDEEGCSKTTTVVVGDMSGPLVVTATPDQSTVCSGEPVVITPGGGSSYSLTDGSIVLGSTGSPFTVNPTSTTTYTIYGNDEFGCSGDTTVTITVIPLDTPLFHIAHTYCAGATIPALPTTSLNPFTGSWSPSVISNTTSGTYIFTPDPGQCATTYTLNVTINPLPTISGTFSGCQGGSAVTLTGSPAGGTWSSSNPSVATVNATTGVVTPSSSASGTTTISYMSNVGCISQQTFTVYPNPVPVITYQDGGLSICAGTTIPLFSSSATGNTWSTGETTQTIYVSAAGSYTVTVNNGNGCSATSAPAVVVVNPNPTITGTFSACVGGSSVTLVGNPGPGTWSSSNPSVATVNSSGVVTPSTSTSGTTTIIYTVTATGCQKQQTFTVNPLPTISGTFTACQGGSAVTLTGTPAGGTWSSSNPSVATVNSSTGVVTPSSSASGTINIVYTSASGCQSQHAFTVYANPVPTIYVNDGGFSFCAGGSITLNSTSANGNTWSTGATTSSITVSTAGTYTVTVNNGNGCSATSAPVTVNSIALPTAGISGTASVCQNAASPLITFTGAGGTAPYTFTYKINGGSNLTVSSATGSNTVTVSAPTGTAGTFTYSLVGVSSAAGCYQNQTGSATITVNPLPTTGISGTATVCQNAASPVITFTGANGTAPYTFTYKINGGSNLTVSSATGSNTVTVSAPTGTAGTFVYSLVSVSSAAGCSQSQTGSVTVTVNTTPTISTPATSACVGGTAVQFTGSPTGGTWSSTAPSIASVNTSGLVTPSTTNSGNVIITYTLGSCSKTQSFAVNPRPAAPTISGPTTICAGETATLTSTTYSSNIVWSPGGATTPSIVVPAPTTSATYTLTYTGANGCTSSTSTTVTKVTCSKPLKCILSANLSVGVVSGCERSFTNNSTVGSVPLTSSTTGYAYQWTISNSNTNALLSSSTSFNMPNYIFSATGTYRVCLTVTRIAAPDCYDEYCVEISVNCSSGLVMSSNTNGLTSGFSVKDSEKETLQNVNYLWDFGDGTFSTEEKPIHVYKRGGSYKVCVKIGNGDLTEAPYTICRTIDVSSDLSETGTIPVLSVNPNPTGGQTTVLLDGAEGKTVEIKLFNMLGEEVTTLFAKTCCNEEMIRVLWNAEEVPPGVYLVKAQVDSKTMIEKVVVSSH